jgi:4-aminobutyrate aminotransferase-like enzyme
VIRTSTLSHIGSALGEHVVEARGAHVVTENGKRYLDMSMGMGSVFLGHDHSVIRNVIWRHAETFVVGQFDHSGRANLLEALQGILPPEFDHVFILNTGAEAVEMAVQAAMTVTGRDRVIRFEGSFHGKTHLTAALSQLGVAKTLRTTPWPGDFSHLRDDEGSDLDSRAVAIDSLCRLASANRPHLAAILIEPIQGSRGNVAVHPTILTAARALAKDEGALLIADEVASGFGRSGEPFAHQASAIQPDILTGGKALSSGFPIGIVALSSGLATQSGFDAPGMTSTTFGANSLCCEVAAATLSFITRHSAWEAARNVGGALMCQLRQLAAENPAISRVTGRGLMLGIELSETLSSTMPPRALFQALLARGVLCPIAGRRIRLMPSLALTPRDGESFVAALAEALATASTT